MHWTPKKLKFILNIYPPYIGAGVKTEYISDDWKKIRVSMKLRWYNKNAVGTHFGGSLYSMVDPHLMLMLMGILGKGYTVWDKSAEINYLMPGKGKVQAHLQISDEMVAEIKKQTANGNKYMPIFSIDVRDENDEKVCQINKTMYIRKK